MALTPCLALPQRELERRRTFWTSCPTPREPRSLKRDRNASTLHRNQLRSFAFLQARGLLQDRTCIINLGLKCCTGVVHPLISTSGGNKLQPHGKALHNTGRNRHGREPCKNSGNRGDIPAIPHDKVSARLLETCSCCGSCRAGHNIHT